MDARTSRRRPPRALILALGVAALASGHATAAPEGSALPSPLELRAQLVEGELDALEARLTGWRRSGERRKLSEGLRAFEWGTADQTRALEGWVEARPASGLARLALAWREVGRAWEARGTGFASSVKRDEQASARGRALRALQLAEEALERDPALVDAHGLSIQAARLAGDAARARRAFEEGLALDPAHGELWRQWMWSRSRRWGGSYRELEAIAREAQRYADENPRLADLRALPDDDRASDLANADRYEAAVEVYDRALAKGEMASVYSARGTALYNLGRYQEALASIDRALELDPYGPKTHFRRSYALFYLKRYDEALREAERAAELAPGRPGFAGYRDQLARRLPAIKRWEAFKRDPTLKEGALYAVGWLYHHTLHSLALVLAGVLAWGGWRAWRDRSAGSGAAASGPERAAAPERRFEPTRAVSLARPVLFLLRASLWPIALLLVSTYLARWEELTALDRWVHLPVTVVAFLGALAFSVSCPLGPRDLWRVWAWLFPIWTLVHQLAVHDLTLDEWYIWGFWHFVLLPVYASLFLYGYRSPALWRPIAPRAR